MINIRGDTLIYTFRGFVRVDKLTINDLIIDNDGYYKKITNINSKKIINKKIYKMKVYNNIDNFYIYDNTFIKCLENIPFELKYEEILNFLNDNPFYKKTANVNIRNMNEFNYISYPIVKFSETANFIELDKKDEFFRFYAICLINNFSSKIIINNDNKNTIAFINKYLYNNNITYDILDDTDKTTFDITDELPELIENYYLYNLTRDNTIKLLKGLIEIYYNKDDISNNYINIETTNKNLIYLLKFLLIKFELLPNILFINNVYIIKIPKLGIIKEIFDIKYDNDFHYNFFVLDNYIWVKIKNIKIEKYTGYIYNIETEDEPKTNLTTEIGIIS